MDDIVVPGLTMSRTVQDGSCVRLRGSKLVTTKHIKKALGIYREPEQRKFWLIDKNGLSQCIVNLPAGIQYYGAIELKVGG